MKTKKAPTPKPRDWTPVLRGKIYCSPACGSGCTHAQYKAALHAANRCLARMDTKGWTLKLHENGGWFWRIEHSGGLLQLSGGQLPYRNNPSKDFHAMLSTNGIGCDACWYDEKRFNDPNEAVQHRLMRAKKFIDSISEPLKLLK